MFPKRNKTMEGEAIIPTMCALHCGGTCLMKVHVKDGKIIRIETDDGEEPQLRACLRGRSFRKVIYAPDRILYPLQRVGERGEAKFKRISWDEALDTVAREIKRVRDTYGPKSILYLDQAGDIVVFNSRALAKVLSLAGGYTARWGQGSFHGGIFASFFSYGTMKAANTREDLLNSRFIIMWGWDPATSVSGTNTTWILKQAREKGVKIIAVDPYLSPGAATVAEEWIPIRPGTDAAMLIAMAYVMITENLHDQKFLDTYTVGFGRFRDYVLGAEDGVPKTPTWAEAITSVPVAITERVARWYATIKPAALVAGTAPGRTAMGEQYHRAAITLAAMTGNVGIHGGDSAAMAWCSVPGGYPYPLMPGAAFPPIPNPVESPSPYASWRHYTYPRVHYTKVADAILEGRAGGYSADYKMIFLDCANYISSQPNINKIIKAVKKLEFIVTLEQFMNPSSRYADIILPTTTFMERSDIAPGAGMAYYGFQPKIVAPLGECKTHHEIARELAARLGIPKFDGETEESHLRELVKKAGISDYEKFKAKGVYWVALPEPYVAFQQQIEDPEHHPFPTPSGKIEIYSQRLADMNNPGIPPIPYYLETWEGLNDPLFKKYPIQLLTNHALISARDLSKYFAVGSGPLPWNKKVMLKAIDGVGFDVISGETFGLVGESGCGKTTLSKLILLLEYPTMGTVTFEGKNIHTLRGKGLDSYRQSVQAVFQDPFSSLNPRMRVGEIVGEPLIASRSADSDEIKRRTAEIMEEVGLSSKQASLYPHQFSGGQRQRIAVARALITHPKFIILDEPVSALDVSIRAQILNLLQGLKKRFGLTYLFIAHDLLAVRYMSDRIGVMYLGKLVEVGPSDDVYSKAVHPYSQLLLKSALPTHPRKAQEWIVPVGEVPNPVNLPPVCRFNTRCPEAKTMCQKETPELKEYVKGHWVACHHI